MLELLLTALGLGSTALMFMAVRYQATTERGRATEAHAAFVADQLASLERSRVVQAVAEVPSAMSKLWRASRQRAALVDRGQRAELLWRDAQYRTLSWQPATSPASAVADQVKIKNVAGQTVKTVAASKVCGAHNPTGRAGSKCDLYQGHGEFHQAAGNPPVMWLG